MDRVARSFDDGFYAIHNEGPWDCIVFDHDLGDQEVPERTGYTLMCELEKYPHLISNIIMIITSNPAGRQRMEALKTKLLEIKDETTISK